MAEEISKERIIELVKKLEDASPSESAKISVEIREAIKNLLEE